MEINDCVMRPNGGKRRYCNVTISIELKRIDTPIPVISSDLRSLPWAISVELIKKARLNNNAPTCFVALKVRA